MEPQCELGVKRSTVQSAYSYEYDYLAYALRRTPRKDGLLVSTEIDSHL
jgi:hypothetical protein